METFATILVLIVLGFLCFAMCKVSAMKEAARIPTATSDEVNTFHSTLPEGFGYPYFLDKTGYAVNTADKKIALHAQGKNYIYTLAQIRNIHERTEKGHELALTDRAHNQKVDIEIRNLEVRKKAYEMSGIYVVVADIDHPEFQIRFADEASQARSWEILLQFREGTLQDYKDYLVNHPNTNG